VAEVAQPSSPPPLVLLRTLVVVVAQPSSPPPLVLLRILTEGEAAAVIGGEAYLVLGERVAGC